MRPRTSQSCRRRIGCALAVAALACTPAAPNDSAEVAPAVRDATRERTVILLSLDGTRPADVSVDTLPTLVALARRGARAERMIPVFPTNTFPNHVTLVTGVEPSVHGIVNNVFYDRERGLFRYQNDPSWIEVDPLWSIAARHGLVSASYHWIGSEGSWIDGTGPLEWKRFDRDVDEVEKVEQILAWIDRSDPAERPRFITSWFRGADREAHRDGPGSASAREALRHQDRALALLVDGLDARRAFDATILLVVSDHGMAPVERVVDLDGALRQAGVRARAVGGGGLAFVYVERSGDADAANDIADRAIAVARGLGLSAQRRESRTGEFATDNARFGDAIAIAPAGVAISGRDGPPMRGSHGYHPDEPEMGALLIAAGAEIPPGRSLGSVRTLDVAPTILAWLGVPPPDWMQGRPITALLDGDTEEASPTERTEAR